jgi:large subunit ribosomal protein L23
MERVYQVIKRPIISEKSAQMSELNRAYAFEVDKKSNKQEIKQAIEKLFNVKVEAVRTLIVHGEYKRTRKSIIKKSNWKKAIVTLKEGNKIELFQGV